MCCSSKTVQLIDMVPWDGQSRYTIVVAGLDRRQDQSNEPVRTDSLMILSIDPTSKSIGLLSIPRDLWVEIPGQDERDRINRAYFLGEVRASGGGAALAAADPQPQPGHARPQLCPG